MHGQPIIVAKVQSGVPLNAAREALERLLAAKGPVLLPKGVEITYLEAVDGYVACEYCKRCRKASVRCEGCGAPPRA